MHTVADHLHGDPRVLDEGGHRARLTVVDRAHGVEQVGPDPGAGIDSGEGLFVGRVGVADGGDDAGVDELTDRVHSAVELRGDGGHAYRMACGVEDAGDLAGIGVAQRRRVVRALLRRGEPRTLEVDAGDETVPDVPGQDVDLAEQLVGVSRDQRCHDRGRSVGGVHRDCSGGLLVGGDGESTATTTVDMHVDEAGHDGYVTEGEVAVCRGARRIALAESSDASVADLHPSGAQHLLAGDQHARGDEHAHNPCQTGLAAYVCR